MEVNIYGSSSVVGKYDLSRSIPERVLKDYCNRIISCTNPKILCDVGFGKGSVLISFAEYADVDVFGNDSSMEMHETVEGILSERKLKASLLRGDARNLSEMVEDLDLVHIKAVTHIPENPCNFLIDVSKAIRKKGYFVLGKEFSQPEDNLEEIGKYGISNKEDIALKDFYETYFEMRDEDGSPFVRPVMPAGDYDEAVSCLKKNGFVLENQIETFYWNKSISFSELIEAIDCGTFTVFSKGLEDSDRRNHANFMRNFCSERGYDLNEERVYSANLKAVILKKV